MKVLLVILSILVIGISSQDEKPNTTRKDLPPKNISCNSTIVEDCCKIEGCLFQSCISGINNYESCYPVETKCPEGSEEINKCNTTSNSTGNDTSALIEREEIGNNNVTNSTTTETTAAINTTTVTVEPTTTSTEGSNTTVITTPSTSETTTASGSNSTSTTSVSNSTASPTQSPNTSTAAAQPSTQAPSQRFDAASFIGGIVLCGAIVSIVFFGIKFYKARTGQNYHTL